MIRAISFDAAGTLITLPQSVGYHYAAVAARHGIIVDEEVVNEAFRDAWRTRSAPEGDAEAHRAWWRGLVAEVFARAAGGVEACNLDFFDDLFAHFAEPDVWDLVDGAWQLLVELRETYRLAVLSNFDPRLLVILDHLGVSNFFEQIILSSDLGLAKPDARLYQAMLDRLGLPAGEVVHVGDHELLDGVGARQAGLRAFVVDPPRRTLADLPLWLAAQPEA